MRFLIDADLPRSAGPLLRRYGHEADDVREIGMAASSDSSIAEHARTEDSCLITGDFGFADVRNYPPEAYAGIVVLALPRAATATSILALIESLVRQAEVLSKLKGRLAIVEPGRVRLRPL